MLGDDDAGAIALLVAIPYKVVKTAKFLDGIPYHVYVQWSFMLKVIKVDEVLVPNVDGRHRRILQVVHQLLLGPREVRLLLRLPWRLHVEVIQVQSQEEDHKRQPDATALMLILPYEGVILSLVSQY